MAIAYKIPPTREMRQEIDSLELRGMERCEVLCPLGCGASYIVMYDPNAVSGAALEVYRKSVEVWMGTCSKHPEKIRIP